MPRTFYKYKPEFCETVIKLMAEGISIVELVAEFKVHRSTIYDWEKAHPEFKDALDYGRALAEAWWLRKGRESLNDKTFRTGLWYMTMKNRFGWRDKAEPVPAAYEDIDKIDDEDKLTEIINNGKK